MMSLESVANDRLQHMLIGYTRVSKADGSQSLDLQRDALQAAGVDARQGLDSCVRALRTSDVLVVWKPAQPGQHHALGGRPGGMGGCCHSRAGFWIADPLGFYALTDAPKEESYDR